MFYWEVIKFAIKKGVSRFDIGSTRMRAPITLGSRGRTAGATLLAVFVGQAEKIPDLSLQIQSIGHSCVAVFTGDSN
jgi:hypothetical protein